MEYIQEGLDKGYPFLEDVHDRRIFKTPTLIENILPIVLKHLSFAELKEAIHPKYYGDFRYQPKGNYVPPVEVPEVATYPEPALSTVAPAAADTVRNRKEKKKRKFCSLFAYTVELPSENDHLLISVRFSIPTGIFKFLKNFTFFKSRWKFQLMTVPRLVVNFREKNQIWTTAR